MATFLRCLFGPQLMRLNLRPGLATDYQAVAAERWGDTVITSVCCAARILLYTSPIVLPWALRQGWITLSLDGGLVVSKFLAGLGLVVVGALLLRTMGRVTNPAYTQFITVLADARRNYTAASKKLISQYDFNFSGWPVDWDSMAETGDQSKPRLYLSATKDTSLTGMPMDMLAWLLTHSFGISLVYPGSMGIMRMLVERPLMEGRTKLMLEHGGERNKVATRDGNQIDTMFVDQRSQNSGSTLVICCEGNAGFYEIGIMATPVTCGYSVLGWNHPGFYGSTGTPYPAQETMAVDAVMQFAITKLGFQPENILVFGWSIGGYSATWLAMNYPDIKGLVLDATFDDLLPLAVPRMPACMSGLVTRAVRNYINLNVGDQLNKYTGPVRLVRRSNDEMICTSDGELWSNRGNNLLISLLGSRYPALCSDLALDTVTTLIYTPGGLDMFQDKEMEEQFARFARENGSEIPNSLGENLTEEEKGRMLSYLATKMMTDLNTTHCTPLPPHKFQQPWDPAVETEFVTVVASKVVEKEVEEEEEEEG
eukprot:GFUD01040415.1.p1 GENE.GFUD01040415.1~~GFUD01040415.1.p1  ORF type:complete len:539 (+),score=179.12 GFUD01040415.1:238-1854(+)